MHLRICVSPSTRNWIANIGKRTEKARKGNKMVQKWWRRCSHPSTYPSFARISAEMKSTKKNCYCQSSFLCTGIRTIFPFAAATSKIEPSQDYFSNTIVFNQSINQSLFAPIQVFIFNRVVRSVFSSSLILQPFSLLRDL